MEGNVPCTQYPQYIQADVLDEKGSNAEVCIELSNTSDSHERRGVKQGAYWFLQPIPKTPCRSRIRGYLLRSRPFLLRPVKCTILEYVHFVYLANILLLTNRQHAASFHLVWGPVSKMALRISGPRFVRARRKQWNVGVVFAEIHPWPWC